VLLGRTAAVWRPAASGESHLYSTEARGGGGGESEADKIDPGLRLGDYPVLPWRSAQLNKQTGWWDNQDRRDKETPLHEEDDALNVWMFDAVECNGIYTKWEALGQLTVAFTILGFLIYLSYLYDAPSRNPAVPRQFPYDNLYLERGGDPDRPPTEQDKAEKIRSTYGTELSS
jgi:NADH dehydrogenase (ubiquinone) 1 beta subcomplex subunit 8